MTARFERTYFYQYCKSSTIHGFQYLTKREDTSWPDRLIWALILMISISICAFLLNDLNEDWKRNPVVTTIESTSLPLGEIPYPAVTICPAGYDIWAFAQRYDFFLT
jgi:hypothetical protein